MAPRVDPVDMVYPEDSVDFVGAEGETVTRTSYTTSSFLPFAKEVKRPPKPTGTDDLPAGEFDKLHTHSVVKAKHYASSASLLSSRMYETHYDGWGLPPLEVFESTLNSHLQEGKSALAAWAAEFYASDVFAQSVETSQHVVCEALWDKAVKTFPGMNLVLRNARPLKLEDEVWHLPHVLQVTTVAAALKWGLLLHVKDADTNREFSLQIPMLREDISKICGVDEFLGKAREAFNRERSAEIQACGSLPAELTGSLKGFAVSLYTGEIAGVSGVCFAKGMYVFNRPKLLDKVQGNLRDLKVRAPSVVRKARDYIAARLLHIVLKLEQAGIGHLALDWDSLFLRQDGAFLLGNFGSSAPFGRPVTSELSNLSDQLEPGILLAGDDIGISPTHGTNLWSLGVLLFQLYTGKDNPYGIAEGTSRRNAAVHLAEGLLSRDVRSHVLVHELAAAGVPSRWAQLILRLLEPRSANRINGFEVTKEFPDLLNLIYQ
ncbi:hypothetical protein, conserved [Eimeria maxima]|uniref:Protein kinase domain-containing protein n=1 Tax=Eimeria maxima TaxID=5804 RepID=U6MD91_EIMMA|nr:hypothetical protein, conserved [Eimeria maxima]CDJ59615.1 hypothetical protein, conserved [Eimeria maxima]